MALLLDTCAAIWVANGDPISGEARNAIEENAEIGSILISPVTGWEIATLASKGRLRLSMAPECWFDALLSLPGIRLAPMPPRTLIASAFLPGDPPSDPADRIIAATARAENLILMTRDHRLLDFGNQGHVRVLAC
jgi:PIN domain nuclease of toxin-antitoxin system